MVKKKQDSLVDDQSPLILPDGSEVLPAEIQQPTEAQFVEVPTNSEAVAQVMRTRRSIIDLPAAPKEMNAISAVVAYKMYGLSDPDISIATSIPIEQVENMQMLDAFDEMWNAAVQNIIHSDSDNIEDMIHQSARNAVNRITHVNNNAQDPFAIIASSKDLLDRHERSKERRETQENNSLRIEIIKRDETEVKPEMEFADGNGG
jgi:hypothetical protein